MATPRRALTILGLLAVVLAACSSSDSKSLNMDKAQREIARLANKAYGGATDIGRVRCPAEVTLGKGKVFFCTVAIDGAPLRVIVRQKDGKGNVRIDQAQSVLVTAKMEDFVASYAAKRGRPASEVVCGEDAILIRTPGKQISCAVTFADGTKTTAKLGVKDTKGNTVLISMGAGSG